MDGIAVLLAHPDIAKLQTALESHTSLALNEDEHARRAAVALVFRAGEGGEPELLFIKRAEYPGDPWSGQVAFPGGREEAGDASLAETVIRETREEIGLDLERGTMLGTLDDFRPQTVRLPAIVVRPYVVLVDRVDEFLLSGEVASVFWISLELLKDAGSWRDTNVSARGVEMKRRGFQHEGEVIWGMTERILAKLLTLLD
ncbi:MAG: NUDIX hydrolase [Gemmatimonadaceae bacterium]